MALCSSYVYKNVTGYIVCVQVQNGPVVKPKLCSMCRMGKEMERNWMSIYQTPTLWVQTRVTALTRTADKTLNTQNCTELAWELTGPPPSVSDVHLVIYLHGGYWQFLRYSQSLCVLNFNFPVMFFILVFYVCVCVCSLSKEESGFMAVPLVDKGVVVVAVGYDIAPKGMSLFPQSVKKYCCTPAFTLCSSVFR